MPWPLTRPIAHVLARRGLLEEETIRSLLHPCLGDLPSPLGLPDMPIAAERLARAVRLGETILVLGDYDVDGITSAALLTTALRDAGGSTVCAIPDRAHDGHGFTRSGLALAERLGARVVVTTDSGTSSVATIDEATARGIDVIVTDHHEPNDRLPRALAVVNPRRADSSYAFRELAAVGVAFRLAQATYGALGRPTRYVDRHLDLVAMGSLADCVPLVGENRTLVRLGLEMMARGQRPGLLALREAAGRELSHLDGSTVVLALAPRINAAGRLGHAHAALRLLTTPDRREASMLAHRLEDANRTRRQLAEAVVHDTEKLARTVSDAPALVAASSGWHPAVLGIAAARLLDENARPVVLIAWRGEEGKGSARAPADYNLHEIFSRLRDLLVTFGGHPRAVGFTLRHECFADFRERFFALVASTSPVQTTHREALQLEGVLPLASCSPALARSVADLGPFGVGHSEPLFAVPDVRPIGHPVTIGRNGLRFHVENGSGARQCVGYRLAHRAPELQEGRTVWLACVPVLTHRFAAGGVELKVKDIHLQPESV
jgi:single-stranded-DNA-specific exonuclease